MRNSSDAGASPLSPKPVLRLTDRLRGIYTLAVNDGAGPLNGSDTFTREFDAPPIQKEAADMIEELLEALRAARNELFWCAEQLKARGVRGSPGDSVDRALEASRAAIAKATKGPAPAAEPTSSKDRP